MFLRSKRNGVDRARRARARAAAPCGEQLEGRALLTALFMSLNSHNNLNFVDSGGHAYTLSLTGKPSGTGANADQGNVRVDYRTTPAGNYLGAVQILDSPGPNFTLNFTSKLGAGNTIALPTITASAAAPYGGIVANGGGANFLLTSYSGAEPLSPTGSINVGTVAGPITVALSSGQTLRTGNVAANGSVTVNPSTPGGTITGSVILGAVDGALNVNGALGSNARVVLGGASASSKIAFNGSVAAGAIIASNADLAGIVNIVGSLAGTVSVVGNVNDLSLYGDALPGSVVTTAGNLTEYINGGNDWGLVKGANVVLKVQSSASPVLLARAAARPLAVTGGGLNADGSYGGNVYAGAYVASTGNQMLFTDGGFNGADNAFGTLAATIGNVAPLGAGDVGASALFFGGGAQTVNVPNGSFNGTDLADVVTLTVGRNVGATASLISATSQVLNVAGNFDGRAQTDLLTATIGGSVGSALTNPGAFPPSAASILANNVHGFSVGGDYNGTLNVLGTLDPLFTATPTPTGTTLNTVTLIGGTINGDVSIPAPTNPAVSQLTIGGLAGNLLIGGALNSDLLFTHDLTGTLTLHGDVGSAAAPNSILVSGNFTGAVNTPDSFTKDTTPGDVFFGDDVFFDTLGNMIGNLAVGGVNSGQINVAIPTGNPTPTLVRL